MEHRDQRKIHHWKPTTSVVGGCHIDCVQLVDDTKGTRIALIAVIVLAALLLMVFLMVGPFFSSTGTGVSYRNFSVNNRSFGITYLATTPSTWESGLMNRSVSNNTTMLFVFPSPGVYSFWMFDTYSNLDMIWLNASNGTGRVVYIVRNASSCFDRNSCTIYTPNAVANYVLEAKAGFADRNGIGMGTRISFG